jgi:hypothetical protein
MPSLFDRRVEQRAPDTAAPCLWGNVHAPDHRLVSRLHSRLAEHADDTIQARRSKRAADAGLGAGYLRADKLNQARSISGRRRTEQQWVRRQRLKASLRPRRGVVDGEQPNPVRQFHKLSGILF